VVPETSSATYAIDRDLIAILLRRTQ